MITLVKYEIPPHQPETGRGKRQAMRKYSIPLSAKNDENPSEGASLTTAKASTVINTNSNTKKTIRANFISSLFFWWMNPIVKLSAQRRLYTEDLPRVPPEDDSKELGSKLEREWMKEVRDDYGRRPCLIKALIRSFGLQFFLLALLPLIEECVLRIAQPLILGQLLGYFDPDESGAEESAYLCAGGIVLCSILSVFTFQSFLSNSHHIAMRIRTAICALVHKKYMRLNQKALGQINANQLWMDHLDKLDPFVVYFHYVWIGPVQLLISGWILYEVIGPSCLAGLAVLIVFVLQKIFTEVFISKLRKEAVPKTEQRVNTMKEVVLKIESVKLNTLEKMFAKMIERYRTMEVDVIRRMAFFRSLSATILFTTSKWMAVVTFIVIFFLTGNHLSADKIFLTLVMINNICNVMTFYFSNALKSIADIKESVKILQELLLLDETTNKSTNYNRETFVKPIMAQCLVDVNHLNAQWSSTNGNTLSDITFTVRPGQTLTVIGHSESGKSSLLNAILGELNPTKGSCKVIGKIAYASQEPWIFPGTIRQNILCGLVYDSKRYKQVIQASALECDLHLLPHGDGTEVGSLQLSTSQKVRINLARCLYVDADVYLLDDPLSAVGTKLGRQLFDQAINGFLRGKIRILVTYHLQYLQDKDHILLLDGGRVQALGSFKELNKRGYDLANILGERGQVSEDFSDLDSIAIDKTTSGTSFMSRLLPRRGQDGAKNKSKAKKQSKDKERQPAKVCVNEPTRLTFSTYWKYLKSGGGRIVLTLFFLSCLVTQFLLNGIDFWLSLWTNVSMENRALNIFPPSWNDQLNPYTRIYISSGLIGGAFIFSLVSSSIFYTLCLIASVKLHNRMFVAVIRSPLHFFEQNPIDGITSRFDRDVRRMEILVPVSLFIVIFIGFEILGIIVMVSAINPWMIPAVLILGIPCYKLIRAYSQIIRNLLPLELVAQNQVSNHFSVPLAGVTTLRAHNSELVFQNMLDKLQNTRNSIWYILFAAKGWFGLWMECILFVYIACVTFSCTALIESLSGSQAGLVISLALSTTGLIRWGIWHWTAAEKGMESTQRVLDYGQLPAESPNKKYDQGLAKKPPANWPSEGAIRFEDVAFRCKKTNPKKAVLKNVTCLIKGKEKVGIVGKTGVGQSSLISALFRLAEPDGKIFIDGVDTKSVQLNALRSKMTLIPQDPVLFSGSLRRNLDPSGKYSDDVLWNVLEDVKLKDDVRQWPGGLDFVVTEGGSKLSTEVKQLVCLSRSILRKKRILILEEANVNQTTDVLIQQIVRDKFKDCTVFTITRHLHKIIDSDRIMIFDDGRLKEFGDPEILLEDPQSAFSLLVEQSGSGAELSRLVKEAAENRWIARMKMEMTNTAILLDLNGNAVSRRSSQEAVRTLPTWPEDSDEDLSDPDGYD